MIFVVNAHLPPGFCDLLKFAGHDAIHTRQMVDKNRTTDEVLNILSVKKHRVLVTKDTDFYYSHLLQGKPWKLILVRTGNIRTRDLKCFSSGICLKSLRNLKQIPWLNWIIRKFALLSKM